MPKTRNKKEQESQRLSEKLARSKSVVFVSQKQVSVKDTEQLRRDLKATGGELQAIKKTLLRRVLADSKVSLDTVTLTDTIGIAFSFNDEVSAAKTVYGFSKTHEGLSIAGGILEGALVDGKQIAALAKLPGRQELLSQLVRTINGPVSGFVNVLAGPMRQFVTVLGAIKDAR